MALTLTRIFIKKEVGYPRKKKKKKNVKIPLMPDKEEVLSSGSIIRKICIAFTLFRPGFFWSSGTGEGLIPPPPHNSENI